MVPRLALACLMGTLLAGCVVVEKDDGDDVDATPSASFSLSTSRTPRPLEFALQRDEVEDRLVLIHAQNGSRWEDFSIKSRAPLRFALNGEATGSSSATTNGTLTPLPAGPMRAGDELDFCDPGTGTGEANLYLVHTPSNSIVFETTFMDVAGC